MQGLEAEECGQVQQEGNATIAEDGASRKTPEPLCDPVERLDDESPLVRGAAVWALARFISREELSSFASEALRREHDATVVEEWRDALAAPLGR